MKTMVGISTIMILIFTIFHLQTEEIEFESYNYNMFHNLYRLYTRGGGCFTFFDLGPR